MNNLTTGENVVLYCQGDSVSLPLGTLVQFKAFDVVMDTGYVSRYDEEDPEFMWVDCVKMGPQRVRKDHTLLEVTSEAR